MFIRVPLLAAALLIDATVAVAQNSPSLKPPQKVAADSDSSSPAVAFTQPTVTSRFIYSSVHVNGPYLAMTFDDGPHATLTPKLLDLLKERNIKATFFVLGQNAAEHPDILRRMAAEGHEIENHSWSHPDLAKLPQDMLRNELSRTQDILANTITQPITMMRPPYGALTASQKQWVHDTYGYRIILWDVDPLDWRRPGAAVVTERILKGARPGSIILSHDIHPGTIDAMSGTLDQLLARGFKFVTVSELIKLEVPPSPGKPTQSGNSSTVREMNLPSATPTPNPYDSVLRAEPQLSPDQAARMGVPATSPAAAKKNP